MKVFKLESTKNPFELTLTEFDDIYKEIALVGYYSTYLTPNITKFNNIISCNASSTRSTKLKEGQYSLDELQQAILRKGCTVIFDRNKTLNMIETSILSLDLNFDCENSIGSVLGFESVKLDKGKKYSFKSTKYL